jgi:hypothetical protein
MSNRTRVLALALVGCACLIAAAAVAWAAETVTIHAAFDPDRLGAPTNISATAKFASTVSGPPSPLTSLTFYAPAGVVVDTRGTGTCAMARLEAEGPSGCPADSRAGFGSGVAEGEGAGEIHREPFTLDFFFAPPEGGRLTLLVYLEGVSPNSVQLAMVAKEVRAASPYGIGFSVEVPSIPTLPGAVNASVESVSLTFGAAHVAYHQKIGSKNKLIHVSGLVIPKTCPRGGFPLEGAADFADGTADTAQTTIPCPRR